MEEKKQVQSGQQLTKKEKANIAVKDAAEFATKTAARLYGGKTAGVVVDTVLQTKVGQKKLNRAARIVNAHPLINNFFARNQEKISQVVSQAEHLENSLVNTMNNSNSSSISKMGSLSNSYDGTKVGASNVDSAGMWKKNSLKTKLIIIGIVAFCFVLIFIVIFIAPLMSLGIIDIEGIGGPIMNVSHSSSYGSSSIPDNVDFWWPIGSNSVTADGNRQFASGNPPWTKITSNFGPRVHPLTGENSMHSGVDIITSGGAGVSNVIASRSGRVTYPSNNDVVNCPTSNSLDGCGGGYGNFVIIDHEDGSSTLYAHLHEMTITVRAGDYVYQGQIIGKIGSSGNSTGPHLHFEVRSNGNAVEPLNYVNMSEPRP